MGLQVVEQPEAEPISLEEAKAHARILTDSEDALLGVLIKAARRYAEARCNRSLAVQTYEATFDALPCGFGVLELPRPPLVAVESIGYRPWPGVAPVTLDPSAYRVVPGTPGLVVPTDAWPSAIGAASVVVRYSAGWAPDELPEDARVALLMLVSHWFDRREPVTVGTVSEVPVTVDALLGSVDWRTRG
jgi:uncharacterized phiE125 gp8 family phage protein